MLYCVFLIFFSLGFVLPAGNLAPDSGSQFYCPPCGCTSDHLKLQAEGNCGSCNMQLIPVKHGLVGDGAIVISDFFRQNKVTNMYYDRFMYPVFFLGIILSIFLFTKARRNPGTPFLATLILAISIYPFQNRIVRLSSDFMNDGTALMFFPISFILFIGPCAYFFIRSASHSGFKFKQVHLLHFLPAAIAFLIHSSLFLMDSIEKNEMYLSPEIVFLGNIEQVLAVSLAFAYIFASKKRLKAQSSEKKTGNTRLSWQKKFVNILTVLFSAWAIVLLLNAVLFDFAISFLTYYPLWLAIAAFLIWIGYECFVQPQAVFKTAPAKTNGKLKPADYTRNLSHQEITTLSENLRELMASRKPYLDPTLTLAKLARQLEVKSKDLTVVLNHGLQKNFYDFLNEYRIQTAKEKLRDPANDNFTILAIAYDSGFNSKSSFNAVFKKHVSMTPKEFKNSANANGRSQTQNSGLVNGHGFHPKTASVNSDQ